jgi:anti-sigma B factor antagonist
MDEQATRPHARLTVREPADGEAMTLALGGDLDIAGVAELERPLAELLARAPQPLQLDLAELAFLDSSGVAVLVRLANHFGSVRTRSAAEPVRRVIEVLGLADRLGLQEA